MRRLGAAVILAALVWPSHAWSKPRKDDEEESADDDAEEDEQPAPKKKKKPAKSEDDDENADFKKQDLNGHDLGAQKKENAFEKDRFFVDKLDTRKSAKGTLVQGSLTSTSFVYHESGSTTGPESGSVQSNSQFNRLFTDVRLQTDFRHMGGGQWDARIDARARYVSTPGNATAFVDGFTPATPTSSQSGLLGDNELELKELWLVRNGKRSDVFIGRQFVPDLAGVKIDGVRVDYASSSKFTLLGFGGLYPIRGSRSITTDYETLYTNADGDSAREKAGRVTLAGGFGAAYRTINAYGSFGGVVLAPLSSEQPRVFGTSAGYWRAGPKLDIYHFAVIDVFGTNAVNAGLTNLSGGLNYKPDQRLRATLSFNRVDTETLNVQAQAFLQNPDPGLPIVQNEAYLIRIATNEARASLSAGLGELQRFEVTAAAAYRYRGDVSLQPPVDGATPTVLPAAKSAELYGSITDRRSIKGLRLGVDGSRIFKVGDATYQRTSSLALRAFAARELANGHGEWEAEVAYLSTKDDNAGKTCTAGTGILDCFGASKGSILSAGGNLYYRFNTSWFGMAALYYTRTSLQHAEATMTTTDPLVSGISGYLRLAYRF